MKKRCNSGVIMNLLILLAVLLYFVFSTSPVCASTGEMIAREQQQIIAKEEIHQKLVQEKFRKQDLPKTELVAENTLKQEANELQFYFKEIVLEGATLLDGMVREALLQDYIGRPVAVSEINIIIRKITNEYIERGYITTRAYLPPQDLSTGKLIIKIIEGKIESLSVILNEKEVRAGYAIPTSEEDVLNLRDLEQGIDQISRLGTYDAKIKIDAGKTDGTSAVLIQTKQKFPATFSARIDNYGAASTGQNQIELQTIYDDLFGLYDSWGIDAKKDLDFHNGNHYNRSLGFQASVPFGYWTVRYFGSLFDYKSTVKGRLRNIEFFGNSQTHRGELERLLHRDGDSKTSLNLSLSHKDYRNYVGDVLLQLGSYRLTLFGSTLSHMRRLWNGSFSASLTYTRGLDSLSASKNHKMPSGTPRAQFNKISSDVSYFKPFAIEEHPFSFSTKLTAQYTPQNLFSSEKISFGGAQTVRGYQKTGLSGNNGMYWRNEFETPIYRPADSHVKKIFGAMTVIAGFDYGWIPKDKKHRFEHGTLTSSFIGLRLKDGAAHGEVLFAKSLTRPSFIKNEGLVIHLKFGLNM